MALGLRPDVAAPVLPGLYAAKVEKVDDDDDLGRISVSIPSVFGASTADLHVTARPCFPYGHFFVPDVGSFVWVAFENGDPTAPVWLGVVYAPGGQPAEAKAKPPKKRVVKTAAAHLVILDDESGKEAVEIREGKGGNSVRLTADDVTIKHANGHKLVVGKSAASIELSGGSVKLELSSSGVVITAPEIKLGGAGAVQAVARVGDQGIGNLGAPVLIAPPGSLVVKAS